MTEHFEKYYHHADVPGAGARRRRNVKGKDKVHVVMGEFKRGTLRSGGGAKVKSRKQAVAIALSEARKAGAHIPMRQKDMAEALRRSTKKRRK